MLDAYRDRLRSIVPNALSQFEHELAILPKSKRQHVRKDTLWAAVEVLKGAQVAVPRSQGGLDVRTDRYASMTDEELQAAIAETNAKLKAMGKLGNA